MRTLRKSWLHTLVDAIFTGSLRRFAHYHVEPTAAPELIEGDWYPDKSFWDTTDEDQSEPVVYWN